MSAAVFQRLADLEGALAASGVDPLLHAGLLARIRRFLRDYAELERGLLGGIQISVPRHLLDGDDDESAAGDPSLLVESLAGRERRRLGFGRESGRDVVTLLDHEGFKVYRPPFPEGNRLQGIFLFDEEVGPAFVADGRLSHAQTNAVFARLYGHYLLDHDPYQIRVVLAGDAGGGARALRATHFAVAFLVGPEELGSYLLAFGWRPGDPVSENMLAQLVIYFEADVETVVARLLSLGLLESGDVAALPALEAEAEPEPGGTEGAVPERFVRLALEAHARGMLTWKELAAHLETDMRSVRRTAAQFQAGDLDSKLPPG